MCFSWIVFAAACIVDNVLIGLLVFMLRILGVLCVPKRGRLERRGRRGTQRDGMVGSALLCSIRSLRVLLSYAAAPMPTGWRSSTGGPTRAIDSTSTPLTTSL